jgi:phage terminase large subunit-like protein
MSLAMNLITEHPATKYAREVVEGIQVAGKPERQACKRHLIDLKRQGSEVFPWVFDEAKANRIYNWFSHCAHVEGPLAGQQIELLDFQKFDLGCIFGWVHKDTGYRRFEKAYIQEARKNAKTTILAGIALYLMAGDNEESPSVYCAANDKEQARILYRGARAMALKSKDISKRLKIRNYAISHLTRGGEMRALSKDTKNKDGLNPSGAIIDEYHAHQTSEIYDLLWTAWGQRAQALMTIITTAGFDTDQNPCYKEYEYCKKILDDVLTNERYFVIIRELDESDDEHDPANWIKANPLRAATPEGLAKLQQQHDEAFDSKDAVKIRNFRVKNLNVWVSESEDSYIGTYLDKWQSLAVSRDEFIELTRGKPCNVGIDLSKKIDLTANAFVFWLADDRLAVTAHGFIPQEGVSRHEKTDRIPYPEWVQEGWITATEGDVTDYHLVQVHIQDVELANEWKVQEICYDPYNATHFATDMMTDGYTCIEVRQGVKTLSEPTKTFRELIIAGRIVHDGSPLLTWCLANAVTETDSNENIKLSKRNATDTKRIDLLAAAINAMVRLPALIENGASVYETRGILEF